MCCYLQLLLSVIETPSSTNLMRRVHTSSMLLDTDSEQVIPDKKYRRLRCDVYSMRAQYLPMNRLLPHSQVR